MRPLRSKALKLRALQIIALVLINSTALVADSVNTKERTATRVAEGVYMIRHKDAPDGFPQGNTTVIIGEREALVVDSCYLPSSAREDIAQIRQWTNKPVRYLLNTHWHYDHTLGNSAYAESFPQLVIIAHRETRRQIEGYNPGWFDRYPQRRELFKQMIDTGKDRDGNPLTEAQLRDYRAALEGVEPVEAEFKNLVDRMPNLMFDQALTIDLGNREVEIKHLGRGNTAGDAIVYLPKEKILIAGDLLDHPVPYLGGGYPSELITTLKKMAALDAQAIIPGHGELMRGDHARTHLKHVTDFVEAVVAEVNKEVYRAGNSSRKLEEVQRAVRKAIESTPWRQRFGGDDKDNLDFFDTFSLPGLVTAAYAEAWRR